MKINLNKDQEVYLTSDTHYNHTNICKGVTRWDLSRPGPIRDFKLLSHMNDTIVNNINSMVGEDDILIHFGDWSFGDIEQIWEFRKRIICKNIYLLFGNHDEKIIDNKILPNTIICGDPTYTQELFTWCGYYNEFEIIYPQVRKNIKQVRYEFVASHYPLASWCKMGRGRAHFHGHCHLPPHMKVHQGKSMDIGVDGNGFKPYSIHEAFKLVQDNPIQTTSLKQDHHV